MDAKAYLIQYDNCSRRARICLEEYEAEAAMIKGLATYRKLLEQRYGKEECNRRFTSYTQHVHRLKALATESYKKCEEVSRLIESIPGIEGDVIRARHIEGLKWNEVADKLYYSYGGVFKAYDRGLEQVQAILDNADQE